MKGSFPKPVYILMTVLGIALMVLNCVRDLPVAVCAAGAGLFAYGANRLLGEYRVKKDPEYAKKMEIAGRDERLAYIADKSRSATLIITIDVLCVLGIILMSIGMKPYGLVCLYITCGIAVLYFIVYQVISRRY